MKTLLFSAGAVLAMTAGSARATWSIVAIDTRTGEVAAASATCLTNLDLQSLTPVMLVGVGAATAQSAGDSTQQNRTFIRDRLAIGMAPASILTGLAAFDTSHQTRQYGMADVLGRTATFSGTGDGQWAGGQTGQFNYTYAGQSGTIVYAIQGNVLTGSPVVQAAVDALRNTSGDVPARVMAAMEAARSLGGDGRCSCDQGDPTSCGSPPPSFTYSAYIAYLLVGRAGDKDGTHGVYRPFSGATVTLCRDLNGDGKPEMIVGNASNTMLNLFTNLTTPGATVPAFATATTLSMGFGPRALAMADVNRDGILDLLDADFTSNTASVRRGTATGGFGARAVITTLTGPQSIATADFDGVNGPDLAIATQTPGNVSIRLNNGSGGFTAAALDIPVGSDPRAVIAADFDRDGNQDLLVCVRGANKLVFLRGNGNGTFQPGVDIPAPAAPTAMVVADIDHDGDLDAIVITQTAPFGITVFTNTGGAFAPTQTIPLTTMPTDVAAGDIDGDGNPDLVLTNGTALFSTYTGSTAGTFSFGAAVQTGWNMTAVTLADLDADGDLDAVFSLSGNGEVETVINRGGGRFDNGIGSAFGDYFARFDIANQTGIGPDPVVQLRSQFDPWRAALVGRPDAVQSIVTVPTLTPGSSGDITIALRDWQGQAITVPITSFTVQRRSGSALASIGAPVAMGGGVYRVPVVAGNAFASDQLEFRADDGVRPVILMPRTGVSIVHCPADLTGDGGVTIEDLLAFLTAFAAGDLSADLDDGSGAGIRDGGVTVADLLYYLFRFAAGC